MKGKLGTSASIIINTNGGKWKTKKAKWCCLCRKRIDAGSYIKRVRGCFAHHKCPKKEAK